MSIFPAGTNGGGQCLATPDVCMTPAAPSPIPIPYPNTASNAQGRGSNKVKISSGQSLRKGDSISMSSGDEAGNAPGGQMSGRFKGSVTFKTGSAKVKVEGAELVYLSCTTAHNGNSANAPMGTFMAPGQTRVKVGG